MPRKKPRLLVRITMTDPVRRMRTLTVSIDKRVIGRIEVGESALARGEWDKVFRLADSVNWEHPMVDPSRNPKPPWHEWEQSVKTT